MTDIIKTDLITILEDFTDDNGREDDTFTGDTGGVVADDTFLPIAGGDATIDGLDGIDTVDYSGLTRGKKLVVKLDEGFAKVRKNEGGRNKDTFANIENIIGDDDGKNKIIGNASDNVIFGGEKNDKLKGGAGADTIHAGGGKDKVDLGDDSDADTLVAAPGFKKLIVKSFGAGDSIDLSDLDLGVASLADLLALENVSARNKSGNAFIKIENADGSKSKILIKKVKLEELVEANFTFNNEIVGTEGDDTDLTGTDGDDVIRGLGGADTYNGKAGDDTHVSEDDGAVDTFVFDAAGFGNDEIQGFEVGVDKIDVSALGITLADFDAQGTGNTVEMVETIFDDPSGDPAIERSKVTITLRDGATVLGTIVVMDVTLDELEAGNFTFAEDEAAEEIVGSDGADTGLTGTAEDDVIRLLGGADTYNGLAGNDTLISEADGAVDTFVFDAAGFGNDEIQGFEVGVDKIDVSALGITQTDFDTQAAGNTVEMVEEAFDDNGVARTKVIITLRGTQGEDLGTIAVLDVTLAELDAANFTFAEDPLNDGPAGIINEGDTGTIEDPNDPDAEIEVLRFEGTEEDDIIYAVFSEPNAEDIGTNAVTEDSPRAIFGNGGNDMLFAVGGANTFFGGNGHDVMIDLDDGATGKDSFFGGLGMDIYVSTVANDGSGNGQSAGVDSIAGFNVLEDILIINNPNALVVEDTAQGNLSVKDNGQEVAVILNMDKATFNDFLGISIFQVNTNPGVDNQDITTIASPTDIIRSGVDKDVIIGSAGVLDNRIVDDSVLAGAGDDLIFGAAGDDVLRGGDGNDTLNGGAGNDILFGGSEADIFIFNKDVTGLSFGNDIIDDFEDGVDLISLKALGIDTQAQFDEQVTIENSGATDLLITVKDGLEVVGTISLHNGFQNQVELTADDFGI